MAAATRPDSVEPLGATPLSGATLAELLPGALLAGLGTPDATRCSTVLLSAGLTSAPALLWLRSGCC
eukprot:scaffold228717_cov39-Prasinocladus_malaysianus.AAC.1